MDRMVEWKVQLTRVERLCYLDFMFEAFLGIWQFLLVFGVGLTLGRWFSVPLPYGHRLALSYGLGLSVFSIAYFFIGLMGGLRPEFLTPFSVLLSLPAAWAVYREAAPIAGGIKRAARSSPLAFGLMTCLLGFYFLGTLVPEREEDSIWYHLGVPIYYLYHGGFLQEVPYNLPSHYPMYGQLHYALSLSVGNDTTAKVFAFLQFFPILTLIYSVLGRLKHSHGVLYGCVFYLCCVHFRLPVMVNVQRTVYFFSFLSMVLLWEALDKRSLRVLLVSSFFCGMAMGTKLNALLFCYLLQFVLILGWAIGTKPGLRKSISYLFVHSGVAWITLSPWMVKSFLITGNPLYPMLGTLFGSFPRFREPMDYMGGLHGIAMMKVSTLEEAYEQGVHNYATLISETDLLFTLGIVSLFLVPFLGSKKHVWVWWTSLIGYLFLTQVWGGATGRLFGINASILVLLIVSTLSEIQDRLVKGRRWFAHAVFPMTGILFLASFVFIRLPYLQSPHVDWVGEPVFGEQARNEWLIERGVRTPDSLEMEKWMNTNVPSKDEVYVTPLGYLSSLERRFVASDKYFGEQFFKWVETGEADDRLGRLGVKWLLIDSIHHRDRKGNLQPYLDASWIPVVEFGTQTLYRINVESDSNHSSP